MYGKSDERSLSSSKYEFSDYPRLHSIHRRIDPNFGIQSKGLEESKNERKQPPSQRIVAFLSNH